jgi:hypothetical protein
VVQTNQQQYTVNLHQGFESSFLNKGCWLAIVNAEKVPPHVGLLFNGNYCSLNIKGKEIDIAVAALLRKTEMLKIPALFIRLKNHPVFSTDFLHEHFKLELEKYDKVSTEATCFAPVRSFMEENYLLKQRTLNYLFELFPALYKEQMIVAAFGQHLSIQNSNVFSFASYDTKNIKDKLENLQLVKPSHD